jgi:DNA repair protein RecN (Recombination protein N)
MLRELSVQNLALIEDVRVELKPGFCAWTGETGAGKTLLLEALGQLLGERGTTELLRADAEELRIVGRFELDRDGMVAEAEAILGSSLEENEIIVSRRLNSAGRSFAYVNEQPVAVGTLRQLGSLLVDIHGQRESHFLLQPSYQLRLLDAFGQHDELRRQFRELAEQVRDLRRRQAELTAQRQQRQRELALVRFERDELDAAALRAGETAELALERERLSHLRALQEFAAAGCSQLYDEEGSMVERVGKLLREAQSWSALDRGLNEIAGRLQALCSETQDIAETLRALAERWQADPSRREEVEERLQLLRRLETKYARPADELIAYRGTLDEHEARLEKDESEQTTVQSELTAARARLKEVGAELHRQRQRTAKRLVGAVQRELSDLGMAEARLEAQLEMVNSGDDADAREIPSSGLDQFELLLAANRGEEARPLRKVASGGELSRTMLALKTVLAAHDQPGTLVFDEIDANVGGRLGDVLGSKLAALGRTHQVICVTHLPQVASYARHQWSIRKTRRGKRTISTIEPLDDAARLEELASMLRGEARGETTRREAAAMLEAARGHW